MRHLNRFIFLTVFAWSASPVFAQTSNSTATDTIRVCDDLSADVETAGLRKELLALLRDKKYQALQDTLNDRHARMLTGEFGDRALHRLTNFTDSADPALEPLLDEWVRTSQSSFMALLVRGKYHASVGWKKRGTRFSDQTSQDQIDAMGESFKKAWPDFVASSKKQPQSVLPYPELMQIASAMGDSSEVPDILARANGVAPKNLIARLMAIKRLSPRWGGSFEATDKILAQARIEKLNPTDLRRLEYATLQIKAAHFKDVEKRPLEALPYYTQAAKVCDSYAAWAEVSSIHYDREDWPQVEAATNQYMRLRPDTAWAYNRRGWALEKQGRLKDAISDFERAAEQGSDYAQNKIGYFYMTGNGFPKDLGKARVLFEKANAQGNKSAKANLEFMARSADAK
jgi:tetratricopeptide (TPR) repeat protein